MSRLDFSGLGAAADAFDAAVDAAPIPDRYCTQSAWVLPAQRAFAATATPWIHQFDEGFIALMRLETTIGRTLLPLEASWGLSTGIVGPALDGVARRLSEALFADRAAWDAVFLSGLVRGGGDFTALVHGLQRRCRLGIGQPTVRCVASLEGGMEGFLSRRTAHFRKNLRRAERRAEGKLRFERHNPETVDEALMLYQRVLAVEARSWKGMSGHGIGGGAMEVFYGDMIPRLVPERRARFTFAWEGEEPVGYVLGGVRGGTYRGLQVSFDARLEELSVGNLLQLNTIRGLCEEGVAAYDLGTDMEYKQAWAEQRIETVPLVIR